jgi:MinD-like ATPase involved in chromosome partitioning or flagellar assembly
VSIAPAIRPFDVAVVDGDLLWRVEYMNLCNANGIYAEDFGTVLDGFSATLPGHTTIVLIGPDALGDAERDLDEAMRLHPTARPLVLAGTTETPAQISEALGGVDVLPLDTPPEELIAHIAELLGAARVRDRDAHDHDTVHDGTWIPTVPIIVVTSAKAGEGATTVATNLAASYAQRGTLRVALVDADPVFGDIALLAGFSAAATDTESRGAVAIGDDNVLHYGHRDEATGVLCVLPPRDLDPTEVPVRVMIELLDALEHHADLIIIDAPFDAAFEGDLLINATHLLLITTPRTSSLKNALVAARYFGRDRRVHLVVNHLNDQRGRNRSEIEDALGVHVLATLPHENKVVDHTGFEHLAVLSHPRGDFARAITAMIESLPIPFALPVSFTTSAKG